MMRFILYLALAIGVWSCGNTPAPATEASVAATPPTTTPADQNTANSGPLYPALPKERIQALYDKCDYIDFVFFNFDFAMSHDEPSAIKSTVAGIAIEQANIKPGCQPIGRVFFQVDGKNVEEADLIIGEGCVYYLFLQDGKHAYANMMTENGFKFYQNIFKQLMGQ